MSTKNYFTIIIPTSINSLIAYFLYIFMYLLDTLL